MRIGTHYSGPVVLGGTTAYDADGAVSLKDYIVLLDGTDEALAMSLADGETGQVVIFKCIEVTNNSVLTPDNLADGATLTFDAVGEVTILAFDGTEWQIIYNTATLA